MKTKNLLLVVLLFATTTTFGQIRLGLVAGLNMANIAGDDADNNAMKMGVHGGLLVDLGLTDNFIIEGGVLYSMKGADADEGDGSLSLNYLEIPIVAKYQLESGLNFLLGPYVGILMSAEADPGGDVKDSFESSDIGLKVGLGYQLESGLGFGAHYSMGFATVYKEIDVLGTPVQPDVKNTVIGISISYMLGSGK